MSLARTACPKMRKVDSNFNHCNHCKTIKKQGRLLEYFPKALIPRQVIRIHTNLGTTRCLNDGFFRFRWSFV